MHRRIPPPLIKEPPRAIEVVKVIFVRLTAPKGQIANLKVRPEMTGRIPVRGLGALALLVVRQPAHRVVGVQVLRVRGQELARLGPERRDALGRVVQVDGEAVGLVVVLHEAEDVVVDVAEEVHLRLHAPVVLRVREGRVLVEEAAVPAAHVVVGDHVGVLDFLLLQHAGGFLEEVGIDPGWGVQVLFVDDF